MIYLDIKGIRRRSSMGSTYLKLINRRDELPFKVEESYSIPSSVSIGRSNKNDIIIKDPFISKNHAIIEKKHNEYYIEDLNSSNGTFVNNEQIFNPIRLQHGDTITIGQVNFIFVNELSK
ncbi:FHA domain-containing protein [Garciella nitratireducens]|uniref:FHA domain-containing protein n=1 Tax=Garciella nitratireducens TaxID=218205 RepID=UPI001FA8AE20|nr:FHA domain-containing protein [Garciella nitratireducens]